MTNKWALFLPFTTLVLAIAAPVLAGQDSNMHLKAFLQNPLQKSDLQVSEIVVKLKRAGRPLDDESPLAAADLGRLSDVAQTPLRQLGVSRSGGQVLALPRTMSLGEAQGIIHRLRLQPDVLWAEIHMPLAKGMAKAAAAAPGAKPEAMTQQLMVKLRDPAMAAGSANNEALPRVELDRLSQIAGVALRHVRAMSGGAFVLELPYRMSVSEAQAIADRLSADAGVKYAEPDRPLRLHAIPTDPYYATYQWDFFDSVGGINLPNAWDLSTGLPAMVIAVIDTGILPHPDLAGRVLPGYDMISDISRANDGDGRDSDPSDPGDWVTAVQAFTLGCDETNSTWHGTHVAGTIAAVTNNGIGVSGVNWGSKILPVRVLGKCGGSDSDIADGARWAAGMSVPGIPANPYPARVMNLSLGSANTPCTAFAQEVVDEVLAQGVVIVAAAGNDGEGVISFPANCNGVIAVTASTRDGTRASYSNYGPEATIAAPGGDGTTASNEIYSTHNSSTTVAGNYIYGRLHGTSMAAPHVSGIVSLMLSVNPGLTPAQVKTALQASAKPFSIVTSCGSWLYPYCGTGIADAAQVVAASIPSGNEVDVRSYVPAANAAVGYNSFLRVINTGSAASPVTVGVIDGDTGRVGPIGQLTASLPPNAAVTYSAQQVEAALGRSLPADKRPRIGVIAAGPVEVQAFMSNPGGIVTQIADAMTGAYGYYVRSYVPAANAPIGYTSFIRVINVGTSPTAIGVMVVDGDSGVAGASGVLNSSLPAGAAVTYTAQQIEAAMGIALPAGQRPRINVWGLTPLEVQSFMSNPGGSVTQINGAQAGNSVAVRSYVPAANAMAGYTSFIRVINAGSEATPIGVALIDGATGQLSASGRLVSSLPASAAITFTAQQIEAALGVAIPAQQRPRILVSSGGADLRVQSFMSNPGGVVTQISGAQIGNSVDVRTYIPAANSASGDTSFLRVINTGSAATPVSVAVINGTTGSVGAARQLIAAMPAGGAVTFTAQQVEAALGTSLPATDRPRIRVSADGPIEVQSFMSNPTDVVMETVDAQ